VNVLYHSPCPDGAFSALAAHFRFKLAKNVAVKFFPHATFNEFVWRNDPNFHKKSEVFLLDYIGKENLIVEMSEVVQRIVLVDHHKTAFEILQKLKDCNKLPSNFESFMSLDKSGATLAWEYFTRDFNGPLIKEDEKRKSMEEMYSYIEDNDLWKRKLPFSKEFSIGLGSKEIQFDINKNPSLFLQLQLQNVKDLIQIGTEKHIEEQQLISNELVQSFPIALGGDEMTSIFGKCLAVITKHPQYRSEMGHQLAMKSGEAGLRTLGAIVYEEENMEDKSKYKISLRSIETEDTSVIAKHYGGGGHQGASSFLLDKLLFEKWRI